MFSSSHPGSVHEECRPHLIYSLTRCSSEAHSGASSRNVKMATDLGELLVPYMPTIRVPRTGDRVFKSECAFSYDSPESEGGLYVCLNTFLGFGREHVERHYRKTGQSVYMHLKRHVKQKATGAAGGAIPRRRNGKVFLDLELNRDFNGDDYEYEDEAKLVIFPDHFEIPLPNIEELPALVTIACDAVLNAQSPYKKQESDSWEEEIQVSKHARSLRQQENGVRIPPSGWKCAKCEMRENLWLNLTDGSVLCGKWFFDGSGGNGHALEHYKETNFPLAVKLNTITPDGAGKYVGNLQRIFDYSPLDPSQDFNTQMAKLGHGLLSGLYSKPPIKSELIEQVMKEEYKQLQRGISPKMFKALVSKGHPEFSSNRQQDAHEFFLHLINLVERNNSGSENPSDVFRFIVEERVQCCQTQKVRYTQRVDYLMQLPAPLEAASNREELITYESKRMEAEENMRPPPEPVRARIPFTACLQAFTEPENVPDFWSSALQAKSAGVKTSRFSSFPEYMVVQIKKFTFGVDWVPKKLDISVDVPDFLDLNRLRATGLQAGEEELPDLTPPIVIPEDTRDISTNNSLESPDIDESSVMQLAEMGFPLEACRKAVYYTGNMGAEMAFNWIIAHMEEPDFAEPLAIPAYMEPDLLSPSLPTTSALDNQPPEESISILTSMGFPRHHTIKALKATNNNLERALDWIFTHPDCEEESEAMSDTADTEPNDNSFSNANAHSESSLSPDQDLSSPRVRDGPGRYELFAFISHMGTSTMSGHYVCHIKKEGRWLIYNDHKVCLSERPPKDLGYMYFYRRLSSC
ncbi:unnamed protein product [Leuciscus chuanchicus]